MYAIFQNLAKRYIYIHIYMKPYFMNDKMHVSSKIFCGAGK